jgi:hypothetical protein
MPRLYKPCDGAGGVVGVQRAEHQVPGEGGLRGEAGGFGVADFADHQDVGSCRSSARSAVAKVKPAFSFTWN